MFVFLKFSDGIFCVAGSYHLELNRKKRAKISKKNLQGTYVTKYTICNTSIYILFNNKGLIILVTGKKTG